MGARMGGLATGALLVAVVLAVLVGGAQGNVIDIMSNKDYPHVHTGDKPALVLFYAPWCGYSKKFLPRFSLAESVAREMPEVANKIVWARIDADTYRDQADRVGVESYPTLFWFPKGDVTGAHKEKYYRPDTKHLKGKKKKDDFVAADILAFAKQHLDGTWPGYTFVDE